MPRSALSVLGAIVLTATVSVVPVVAAPWDQTSTAPSASSPTAVEIDRLAGPNRYATAAEIAQQWSANVDRVYVVSGDNHHDALLAAARAGVHDAPVLLTKSHSVPSVTAQELARLNPTKIFVIGSSSSVSNSVRDQLEDLAGSGGVERVAGGDRYQRSALLAKKYSGGRDRVFLASGEDYPDALSAAALAGTQHEPLLLTRRGSLPSEVVAQLDRLNPTEVVVLGGSVAVSDAVVSEAASYATSGKARRVSGQDRYATAAAAAKEFPSGVDRAYVASGQDFSDALVVSALAGRDETAVALTPANRAANSTVTALRHLSPNHISVAGGQSAVSNAAVEQIADGVGGTPVDPKPPVVPDPPAPQPPSGDFPDENSTGVPDGVTLTPSGSIKVTQNGTVINGLHVQGTITVEADNVVIRNTLVQGGGDRYPIRVRSSATNTLIENVEVDNLSSTGIGIYMTGNGTTVRNANIHSAEDGIRIQADDVLIEDSYIHHLHRSPGGHHDSIQIRNGDDITIRENNLQIYNDEIDHPMNAAIQIGSLSGDDQISNLLVTGNLMNGGNFTVNGGGRQEVDSARYSHNEFGRDFRHGVRGNLQNSVWENTNVWHDTGKPVG